MTPKKPAIKIIPLRLSADTIKRAKAIARTELLPYSAILRRAIVEWLDTYKAKGRK
jgi:hypothetical protein